LLADHGTIDHRQIHADDPDPLFSFSRKKIRFQSGFRTPERDIEDPVILQIAESSGVALPAREEVLVDAQNLGAHRRMLLPRSPLEMTQEIPLHGRRANALASAETAPVDPVQVLLVDHLLEAFAGSLARLHARQALAKRAAAIQAAALAHLQVQRATAETPVVMAYFAAAPAFVSQMRSAAVWTRYRPRIPSRDRNRTSASLDRGNLVLGQTQ